VGWGGDNRTEGGCVLSVLIKRPLLLLLLPL
jgi:hypothetical protein